MIQRNLFIEIHSFSQKENNNLLKYILDTIELITNKII